MYKLILTFVVLGYDLIKKTDGIDRTVQVP